MGKTKVVVFVRIKESDFRYSEVWNVKDPKDILDNPSSYCEEEQEILDLWVVPERFDEGDIRGWDNKRMAFNAMLAAEAFFDNPGFSDLFGFIFNAGYECAASKRKLLYESVDFLKLLDAKEKGMW